MAKIKQESKSSAVSQLSPDGQITLDLSIAADQLIIGDNLGQGGFGIVRRAKWGNKQVAVKELSVTSPTEQEKTEFKQEAAIMFRIGTDSEHVVRLYKIMLQPLSLVMELMPKGNLYELLALHRDKPLEWKVRYRLAMDISMGLEDIHRHGILHRDLKSMNVLLGDGLRAKLSDFGLATVKTNSGRHSSSVKGTPHWMAPEVINGEADTEASDVYSLGMVLWELATHQRPYAHLPKPMQVLAQVMQGKQETIPDHCPPGFKQLILDCWSLATEKRPKAIQVSSRLQPLLESKTQQVAAVTGLASLSLGSVPNYQLKETITPAVEEKKVDKPTLSLASIELQSKPHYQPPKVEIPAKHLDVAVSPKPVEEKNIPGAKEFEEGMKFVDSTQFQNALPHFREAAKVHYPPAYIYLGWMYKYGYGVDKDSTEAATYYHGAKTHESWFLQQANSGNVEDQYQLGCYFEYVLEDTRDLFWYRKAAGRGYARAQNKLGMRYTNGEGVPRNLRLAQYWYEKAAAQDRLAKTALLPAEEKNIAGANTSEKDTMVPWFHLLAAQGDAESQCNLGLRYYNGEGVTQDYAVAVTCFRRAADQGYEYAQYKLGACYELGEGIGKDLRQAQHWYEKAAAQGSELATNYLDKLLQTNPSLADNSSSVSQAEVTAPPKTVEEKSTSGTAMRKENLSSQDESISFLKHPAELSSTSSSFSPTENKAVNPPQSLVSVDLQSKSHFQPQPEAAVASKLVEEKSITGAMVDISPTPLEIKGIVGAKALEEGRKLYDLHQHQNALLYLLQAAKDKYPPAYVYLGSIYSHDAHKMEESSKYFGKAQDQEAWFLEQAKSGRAEDQYELARYYITGPNKNPEEAVNLLRKAVDQGYARAQNALAKCYRVTSGYGGLTPDDKQVFSLYRRAAEQGDADSQSALAGCYRYGTGVGADLHQAIIWYKKAEAQDHAGAKKTLHELLVESKPKSDEKNGFLGAKEYEEGMKFYDSAKYWEAAFSFYKAERNNYPPSYIRLGLINERGLSRNKNIIPLALYYIKAQAQEDWFLEQAKSGRAEAQYHLGLYYAHAAGSKKDPKAAVSWYSKAAGQGYARAQFDLGMCYQTGQGVSKDLSQAKHWYEKAAAQGHEVAKTNLSNLLEANPSLAKNANFWNSNNGSKKPEYKPAPKSFFESLFS